MGRAKSFQAGSVYKPTEYSKQTARKILGGKTSKKQSGEVKYDFCGCCPAGLVVYPESIEDVLDTDCNYAFRENFEMFLRKQYDKNTETDMQFKLKHEQRMNFASLTVNFGRGARCCAECSECRNKEKLGAHLLGIVGKKFTRHGYPDDLLEGFDKADALITHLKDLGKDFGLKNFKDITDDNVKAVKKDLVVSGYCWVVEQLEAALKEFKEFRDGLGKNEMDKWDKSVVQQSEKWSDFECGEFETYEEECESFEKVDALIKELHKGMDDILARYNNRNKDIDSLVELIERKLLGAVPKKKKEKSCKKKKKERTCKDDINYADDESEENFNSQQSEEKVEEMQELVEVEVDKADVMKIEKVSKLTKSVERLISTDKSNLSEKEELLNSSRGEKEKGSNEELLTKEAMEKKAVSISSKKIDEDIMAKVVVTEVNKTNVKKSELSKRGEKSPIRVKLNLTPKYPIQEKHEKYQNGDKKDILMNKRDSTQKEALTDDAFGNNVKNGENQVDKVQKDNAVNGQFQINKLQNDKKREKGSKPKCARESCPNKGRHKCSRCKAVFYCAQDCLNEDWPHHKMFCDYVFKANKVPHDETSNKSSESSGAREEVD